MSYLKFYELIGFNRTELNTFKNILELDLEELDSLVKAYVYLNLVASYGFEQVYALEIVKRINPTLSYLETLITEERVENVPIVITNRRYITYPTGTKQATFLDLESVEEITTEDFLEQNSAPILVDSIDLTAVLLTVVYPFISQIDQENAMSETQPQEQTPGETA